VNSKLGSVIPKTAYFCSVLRIALPGLAYFCSVLGMALPSSMYFVQFWIKTISGYLIVPRNIYLVKMD
jgi:hypothetical protein